MIDSEKIQPYPELKPLDVLTAYASGTTPRTILAMDNNLDIILNLIQPRTIDELRENGIPVLESQRLLLLVWRLIKQVDNNKYQFSWPVMTGEKLNVARVKAQQIARVILEESQSAIRQFLVVVQEENFTTYQFPLLASLVLDGMVWNQLKNVDLVDNLDIGSIETDCHFWKGYTWITYPQKNFDLGTNVFDHKGYNLYQSRTPQSKSLLKPIQDNIALQAKLIDFVDNSKTYKKDKDHEKLVELGFIKNNQLIIPYLHQEHPLWQAAKNLALQVTCVLKDELTKINLESMIGIEFKSALIIFYHEIYPAMLEYLIEMDIELPGVMTGNAEASIAHSFFITKNE